MLVLPDRLLRIGRIAAVAFGIACVLTIAVLLPLWVFIVAPRQRAAQDERVAGLPDAIYLVQSTRDPASGRGELDALVEADRGDPVLRLLRAGVRVDAGDRAGAAADLQDLAARQPSPYLDAVAARYAAADGAPVLTDLPPPQQDVDHLVAGFHALRQGDPQLALRLLQAARDYAPAHQLALVAALQVEPADADTIADAATRLEQRRGHATSRTRHALARAMLLRSRFAEAAKYCEESLQLRSAQPAVLHDLAAAEFALGNLARAGQSLRQALALQPGREDSQRLLQQIEARR